MVTLSPLELAHRQRRFWHFLRMRWLGRSDLIYRNYDLLARWQDRDSAADFKYAGFRQTGEALKPAMNRLAHNIWLKYHRKLTDVTLMQLMREYVIWQRIHDGELTNHPTRPASAIKALNEEDRMARARSGLLPPE